jgi:hypothetical protein
VSAPKDGFAAFAADVFEQDQRVFTNRLLGLMDDGSRADQVRLSGVDLCKLEPGMTVRIIDRATGLVTFDLPQPDRGSR